MKQGLEGRLRKLEREYAAELVSERVITIRWLTADEIRRGRRPGLYEIFEEEEIAEDVEISHEDEIVADVEMFEADVDSVAVPDPVSFPEEWQFD